MLVLADNERYMVASVVLRYCKALCDVQVRGCSWPRNAVRQVC
jgi:hypothetical protein